MGNPYNGFSPEFRDYTWKYQKWLCSVGLIQWHDKPCDMCGLQTPNIMPHLEDYTKPAEFYPLCIECHMTLHGRFSRPNSWINLLARISEGEKCRDYGEPGMPTWKCVSAYLYGPRGSEGGTYPRANQPGVSPRRFGDRWFHHLPMSTFVMYPQGYHLDPNTYHLTLRK